LENIVNSIIENSSSDQIKRDINLGLKGCTNIDCMHTRAVKDLKKSTSSIPTLENIGNAGVHRINEKVFALLEMTGTEAPNRLKFPSIVRKSNKGNFICNTHSKSKKCNCVLVLQSEFKDSP